MEQCRGNRRAAAAATVLAAAVALPGTAGAHIPEPSTWQPLPLELRLLQPDELLDLVSITPPSRISLRRFRPGAVAAMEEQLGSPSRDVRAMNVVVEFATPQRADRQARKWDDGVTDADMWIAFAAGDFAYLVAITSSPSTERPSLRVQLVATADEFRRRVAGHPGP